MVAILEKIKFVDISFGGKCNLFHYGTVQDCLQKRDFEFSMGHLYGIVGEFGEGGVALSCGITGNTGYYEGKIYIDDIEKTMKDVVDISWYIGGDLHLNERNVLFHKKPQIYKNTIKEQIEYGINCGKTEESFFAIQNMFSVSSERVGRNINFVSGERWKASAAIGYANGKSIFCYPWMNTRDIEQFGEQMSKTVKCLLDAGKVVIIPTTKEDNVYKIFSDGEVLFL